MHKITKYYHSSLHVCVHRLSLLRDANASSAAINILKSIDYLQYLPCEQSFGFAWRRAAGRPAVLGRRSAVAVVASGGTECRARHIFRTVERAISFVSYLSSFRARHIFRSRHIFLRSIVAFERAISSSSRHIFRARQMILHVDAPCALHVDEQCIIFFRPHLRQPTNKTQHQHFILPQSPEPWPSSTTPAIASSPCPRRGACTSR